MTDPVVPTGELDARFSARGAVATPWEDVCRLIADAELFWISTVRIDGRPHVTPLPAVWNDGVLHFCTGAGEQKAVNLTRNAHCALTTGTNRWKEGIDVVIEGDAVRVRDDARLRRLADAWAAKYHGDWHFDVDNQAFQGEGGEAFVFEVVASKILAFAKDNFAQTRYACNRSPPHRSTAVRRAAKSGQCLSASVGSRDGQEQSRAARRQGEASNERARAAPRPERPRRSTD